MYARHMTAIHAIDASSICTTTVCILISCDNHAGRIPAGKTAVRVQEDAEPQRPVGLVFHVTHIQPADVYYDQLYLSRLQDLRVSRRCVSPHCVNVPCRPAKETRLQPLEHLEREFKHLLILEDAIPAFRPAMTGNLPDASVATILATERCHSA